MAIKKVEAISGCFAAAADDEPLFVLRANDVNAPMTVRYWCDRYVAEKGGVSKMSPKQWSKLQEAMALAEAMEAWKSKKVREEGT